VVLAHCSWCAPENMGMVPLILPATLWPWSRLSLLTKMSTRNLLGGKSGRRVGLTTLPPSVSRISENVGASTSHNPKGLHVLYEDNFTYLPDPLWCLTHSELLVISTGVSCYSPRLYVVALMWVLVYMFSS
jgi:hypothetical protein